MNEFLIPFLAFALVSETDSSGIYGGIFHYAMIFVFMGSAFLGFFYFWRKGQLNMDEEPKLQMMRDDQREEFHDF